MSPANAGGSGSIPGEGAKFPHASGPKKTKQAMKWKQYGNKFNKHFKKMVHNNKKNIKKSVFKEHSLYLI